jgi:hypothetical protein
VAIWSFSLGRSTFATKGSIGGNSHTATFTTFVQCIVILDVYACHASNIKEYTETKDDVNIN